MGKKKKIVSDAAVKTKLIEDDPKRVRKPLVVLLGEFSMVKDFAIICAENNYDVIMQWNETSQREPHFSSPAIKFSKTIPANCSIGIELTNTNASQKRKNIEQLSIRLAETAPILSSSITLSATEQATWISHKHRLVGIAAMPTFIGKPIVEIAPTIYTPKETLEVVSKFFSTLHSEIEIVQDQVGMVLPRLLCQCINEMVLAITEDVASPHDIDTAIKLGAQFPFGLIERAEQIGMDQVYAILSALYNDTHEERYVTAPLLKQMALTGHWWKSDAEDFTSLRHTV